MDHETDGPVNLETLMSGPAWVRLLAEPDGNKMALFIEFAEDESGEVMADIGTDPTPPPIKAEVILPPGLVVPVPHDEYAPADVEENEAILTV